MNLETVRDAAIAYLLAGFVVIKIRLDGSKAPAIDQWKRFQNGCPTIALVNEWFSEPAGIGLVCGISGLEILDCDSPALFPAWISLIRPELYAKLVIVQTGGGGYQVLYRCRTITGNTKISSWEPSRLDAERALRRRPAAVYPSTAHGCFESGTDTVRFETRGIGGYAVAVGSPAAVHASGNLYRQISGPTLPSITTITPSEREELWQAAKSFDCRPPKSLLIDAKLRELKQQSRDQQMAARPAESGLAPWEDFDRRGSWPDLLDPIGWTSADGIHWTRPGKTFGTSAKLSTNEAGELILTVFSSSAGILSEGVHGGAFASWGLTRAFTALLHNGDASAAGKALYAAGYGSRRASA